MIKEIIKDKELIYDTEKYDVILVGTSIYCMLTGGFQSKMRFKYPFLEPSNDKTPYGDRRKLGNRLTFRDNTPIISLMYICNYPRRNKVFIDYDAFEKCLLSANGEFSGLSVASTMIGMSNFDGNGDINKCIEIIERSTPNIEITLYDYQQKSRAEEQMEYLNKIYKIRKNDKELYKELYRERKTKFKELYLA